ncbi:MAG: J domain-containing protein [Pseudanabaena sp. ELA607]
MHPLECYRLLGLPRNATLDDIKVAYRRLARKYHPDTNRDDPNAAEKFQRVQEAYRILKDSDGKPLPPMPQPTAPIKIKVEPKPNHPPRHHAPHHSAPPQDKTARGTTAPQDPETKLKLDMINRVRELLRQKKYLVAIPLMEGMNGRFPNTPEVIHWQAVVYYRYGNELIVQGKLRQAEIFLQKALNTDPANRELCFECKRDLERIQMQKPKEG